MNEEPMFTGPLVEVRPGTFIRAGAPIALIDQECSGCGAVRFIVQEDGRVRCEACSATYKVAPR